MEEARKLCYGAAFRDGTDKDALLGLLEFSMHFGEISNVGVLLERLHKLGVETGEYRFNYDAYCQICKEVTLLMDEGQLDICLAEANSGLLFSRRSLFLRLMIVKCLIRLGQLSEAKRCCYDILLDAPNYVPAVVEEGVISFIQGNFELSLIMFKRALELEPNGPLTQNIKTYQDKAGKFDSLIKKAACEQRAAMNEEAIVTISSIIVLGLNDKEICINKEFFVPLYNSRSKLYELTNQMDKMFNDCIKSLNIKHTSEAEDLKNRFYASTEKKLVLEQESLCKTSTDDQISDKKSSP